MCTPPRARSSRTASVKSCWRSSPPVSGRRAARMEIIKDLFLIIAGIAGSAFFSGTETGLISLNRVRLRHEVERKSRRALIISGFVESTERLLGTTLLGNSVANVLVGVYASALAGHLFSPDNVWT